MGIQEIFFDRHTIVNDPNWIIDMVESIYYPEEEKLAQEIELAILDEPDEDDGHIKIPCPDEECGPDEICI